MIEDSPELLRQTLSEYGYLDESDETDNDGFLINKEATELDGAA